ncbi:hypothetical protein [Protaetiibacter larvae]|uniref:Uncharacterized protein n=1 Tax=Protaetiibacter larvae TaxID=2592654 RepID=A0A5C1Y6N2_9MICO|nr:hypothetical protein [Protaetiibacter larvae]QEO09360.1 hypothetical protein FLP23_04625 [Protaetiibacter larvae]
MAEMPDNVFSAFLLLVAAWWQLVVIVVGLVLGYVLLSLALGRGARAAGRRFRRRREATRSAAEFESES